jgi:hypothetical protein
MSYTTQNQLILRNVKGSALTYNELDGNLYYLSQSVAILSQSAVLNTGAQSSSITLGNNVTISGSLDVKGGAKVTGSLYISGSAFGTDFVLTSDESLKTDVLEVKDGLYLVEELRPVTYKKEGKPEIGFIAQEVQKVIPQAVYQGENDLLYLSMNQVTALNTSAIQELLERVKQLESELEDIKSKLG